MNNPFHGLRDWQVPHAANVLRALVHNKAALDASETGTGKTYCALVATRILGVTPLVLGPKGTRAGWEDASKLMDVPVQFINYEKARRESHGFGEEIPHGTGSYWQWSNSYSLMIFDEAHLCGGSTSLTGKLLRSARKAAEHVLCLSATAADNALQMKNIGQALGIFDGKGYYKWVLRHGAEPDWTGRLAWTEDAVEQQKAMTKIHREIFPRRGARLRRSDVPGFPQTIIDTLLLEPDSVKKGWDADAETLEERVSLRQELENEISEQLHNNIRDELEGTSSVLVFLNFRKSLDAFSEWATKKHIPHGIIDGRQVGEKGDDERRAILEKYYAREIRLLLINCAAGGAGLNCHSPDGSFEVTSFIIPSESGRQMKQVCGRPHRDGGCFSRQFFCGLKGTFQEENLRRNQLKIRNINALNGDELESLQF